MSRKRFLGIIGVVVLLAGFSILLKLFLIDSSIAEIGALQINSIPKTEIFVDGSSVGQTPYLNEKLKPGEYQIKVGNWQAKIKLTSGALTYISREISDTEEKSAGQVLTLEKLPSVNSAELSLVSDPDKVSIIVDGLEKGQTPILFKNILPGDHTIVASLPGYSDQVIQGRLISGYRLIANIKLRKLDAAYTPPVPTLTPEASISAQIEVQITPVGFLRVRAQPDVNSLEVGKVYPKEKFDIVSQNTDWVQIKFKDITGWVAKDYVNIL